MTSEPLVTGIVIFLNAERFLAEALESMVAQTYKNWEIVLIDDGSWDGSTEIAKSYVTRYPNRIRYFEHDNHENRGMSASRNRGIHEARGEIITFLDSDDVWVPHKLAQQVALMKQHLEAAMCFGPTLIWHSWRDPSETVVDVETEDWHLVPGSRLRGLIEPPDFLVQLLDSEWRCPCTCSVMIRRAVFDEVGAFEEEFRGQHEDMVFYTKVFLRRPVFASSECWGWYRQHPKNSGKIAMATGEWLPHQPNRARHRYLRWVERYLKEQGNVDPAVLDGLDRELQPYQTSEWLNQL